MSRSRRTYFVMMDSWWHHQIALAVILINLSWFKVEITVIGTWEQQQQQQQQQHQLQQQQQQQQQRQQQQQNSNSSCDNISRDSATFFAMPTTLLGPLLWAAEPQMCKTKMFAYFRPIYMEISIIILFCVFLHFQNAHCTAIRCNNIMFRLNYNTLNYSPPLLIQRNSIEACGCLCNICSLSENVAHGLGKFTNESCSS